MLLLHCVPHHLHGGVLWAPVLPPLLLGRLLYSHAVYFAVVCLSASIIFRITYIHFLSPGPTKNHAITTTTFACMAAVLYATEVAWVWVWPGDVSNCVPTLPGMLRRLENYVACVIFIFISSPYLYQYQLALVWYVARYSICFILGAMNFMVKGSDCDEDKKLPVRFPRFLSGQTVLSIFFYITAWSSGLSTSSVRSLVSSPSGPAMGAAETDSPPWCASGTNDWL